MGITTYFNFSRKIIHILFGLGLFYLNYILSPFHFKIILWGSFACLSLFEFFRIFFFEHLPFKDLWLSLFKKEEIFKLSDAWFYLLGLIFSWYFLEKPFQFRLILLILIFADPIAAFTGFYIGRYKIYKCKTLEGSLAFFITTLLITYLYTRNFNFYYIIFSLTISLAETFTKRDNLWIPVIGSFYLKFINNNFFQNLPM